MKASVSDKRKLMRPSQKLYRIKVNSAKNTSRRLARFDTGIYARKYNGYLKILEHSSALGSIPDYAELRREMSRLRQGTGLWNADICAVSGDLKRVLAKRAKERTV